MADRAAGPSARSFIKDIDMGIHMMREMLERVKQAHASMQSTPPIIDATHVSNCSIVCLTAMALIALFDWCASARPRATAPD